MPEPQRCAVLGDPIDHSLSPVLHRAAYAELGLDWTYEAVRVPAGGLADFLAGLDGSWRGLSLTMPLKRELMGLVGDVSERAALVGAANTLVLDGERRHADNTDLPGAVAAVRERYAGPVATGAVLGGGATAASTGLALCDLGARRVTLHVRSPERGEEAAAAVRRHPARPEVALAPLDRAPEADVLVSTVPATAQTPDLVAGCRAVPVVFEVVYDPWPTPLAASVGGDRVLVGGLDLLVHQAALQVELFTGTRPSVERMRAAGEAALRGAG
ncbi:shikimate dehydrogenase [Nocardioides sp. zg-579]|uniref:Shikimate dehydrogenase n=1 Tax=Nocardioides marmotae TaxID=2663857 RepID=A0A6I3JHH8_9ACTN|nr:shikimate dehydrogenase [Nocardioides marmotae]MCR6033774.1 shikimate dehydrogenase [Gordonia jinghuaiqii]MTB97432.1 shikimate dehydrogenase [Nocardioides marmotae]QKE01748.1 shikimate dehydrogenase [Nocardioides marmotae]